MPDVISADRELDRGSTTATPMNVSYRVDRISQYLSGHWLDLGCADGGYHEEMLARGLHSVTGVDVEEDRIADAMRRNLANASYATYDGRFLPHADEVFDGTLMNEVLEHVADERQALSEVFRVLKPGGVFVLISPNRWFPIDGHFVRIGSWTFGPAPLIPWLPKRLTRSITVARNYWPRELQQQVVRAGFTVKDVGFIWPVLESYPWLPPRALSLYQKHFRKWDQRRGVRRFGLSTMVVGVKPALP